MRDLFKDEPLIRLIEIEKKRDELKKLGSQWESNTGLLDSYSDAIPLVLPPQHYF